MIELTKRSVFDIHIAEIKYQAVLVSYTEVATINVVGMIFENDGFVWYK